MSDKIQARIEPAQPQAEKASKAEQDGRAAQAETGANAGAPNAASAAAEPANPASAAGAASANAAPEPGAFARASRWLDETFPHSRNAVLGGLCGLLLAILLFSIGLIKTLVIAILVLAGVALGQYADGDPKLVRIVEKLIKKH